MRDVVPPEQFGSPDNGSPDNGRPSGRPDRAGSRDPAASPDPAGPDPAGPGPTGIARWRVSPALPSLKLLGAGVLALIGVAFADDTVRIVLAGGATVGLAVWAIRDLVVPVRVAADDTGVTVSTGYASRQLVPWGHIERIRVDTRPRLGVRTETLEIDAGETLHLFSAHDLGAPPAEVASQLQNLRTRHQRG